MNDPRELLCSGNYLAALDAYNKQIAENPRRPSYNNRATTYLLLGNLDAALADYATAGFINLVDQTISDHAYLHVAGVLWLKQLYQQAASIWRYAVEEMLRNRFTHTDAAGGVHCACLLWFASASLGEQSLHDLANRLLKKRLAKRASAWPTPIATLLLGQRDFDSLALSKIPARRDRQLCQAHFYAGALAIASGNLDSAIIHFTDAVATNAFIELEYFLAKHEVAHLST